ncbi:MAG: glycerophosphodiester phosphodiesterase family protein [Desulfobacterales bacterium]
MNKILMNTSLYIRYKHALDNFFKEVKAVVGFEVWFSLTFAAVLAPLSAWLLNRLLVTGGQLALSNDEIIGFFLSFQGVLFILISITFFIGLTYLEQVGLMMISLASLKGRVISVSNVLWADLVHFVSIIRLGLLQATVYGAVSLPFLAAGALTYIAFLGDHDINYYLAAKPWQWWTAVATVGVIAVCYLGVVVWLYVRWLFAVPILIFENKRPVKALTESWQRTRHRVIALGVPQAVWWLFILLVSILFTFLFKEFFAFLLARAGLKLAVILPFTVIALVIIAIIDLSWLILGKAVHIFLIIDFYRETINGKVMLYHKQPVLKKLSPAIIKKVGWIGICIILASAIAVEIAFLENLNFDRRIAVTAHRGSSFKAPENTISALRQAIIDGAGYAEIDVQSTSDGKVILMHDADLMRIASVNRSIQKIRYDELDDIDIGSWFSEDFSNERIAKLNEAIKVVDGHMKLNIELKYNRPDPQLVDNVGNIIRSNVFSEKCVVSSLDYRELQKFRESFPEVKTGLIIFRALGNYAAVECDFLSIHAAKATSRLVKTAHQNGKEIHVWTVNDLQTALSMIEVGVDNIITDDPEFIQKVLRTWNDLTDTEKIALWLRNLIIDVDPAMVAEL